MVGGQNQAAITSELAVLIADPLAPEFSFKFGTPCI
jgi:hypothetical protein